MKYLPSKITIGLLILSSLAFSNEEPSYAVVDTGQSNFYDNKYYSTKPKTNEKFYGQDASYDGYQPSYENNFDGSVSDKNTKLIWQKKFSEKLTWSEAVNYANNSKLAGYNDWRIPTIKELYSLIDFSGVTGTSRNKGTQVPNNAKPYINTKYFDFEYSSDKRYIDAQYWTQTDYTSTTMNGAKTFFGVNFADGRIKGYPKYNKGQRGSTKFYLRLVRGNSQYGKNDFVDKKNGVILDNATKLSWMKKDSGDKIFNSMQNTGALNWEKALSFCERLDYAGIDSWRLPNAKELHTIVDYTKSPDSTNSASINELFNTTSIKNAKGQKDYPFYWTSTTHLDGHQMGNSAVYFAFGRAMGYMKDRRTNSKMLLDVHGAGAQRSDPKSGDASKFKYGRGPQGDVISINNYVRCVSDSMTSISKNSSSNSTKPNYNNHERKFDNQNSAQSQNSNEFQKIPKNDKNNLGHAHRVLQRFDRNSDEKISYEEAPRRMKENFKRHDENDDGYLDIKELDTLPVPR